MRSVVAKTSGQTIMTFLVNFVHANLLLPSIVFSLTIVMQSTIKAFLKQILGMQSAILSFLYAYCTIDNKKSSINGSLRYSLNYRVSMNLVAIKKQFLCPITLDSCSSMLLHYPNIHCNILSVYRLCCPFL